MKNNIRVNINGIIFNIDDDAHKLLRGYLDRLRFHFGTGPSSEEIIFDIEARIAEMFIEKNGNNEAIIDKVLVSSVIEAMGEPSEIYDEEQGTNSEPKAEYEYARTSYGNVKRRLYRDADDKIVGGVASGLAIYFDIDRIWVRLAFVLLTVFGMSILVYVILWMVIPRATTTAQKLEMRGEEVTLENIRRTIREEYDELSDSFNDLKNKHFRKKKGELTIFEKIAHLIVRIVTGVIKIIGSIIGVFFAFIALIIIIAILPSFIGGGMLIFASIPGVNLVSLPDVISIFTTSSSEATLIITSLAMVLFIPLIALVYQGIKLIFGINNQNKVIGATLLTIWVTGVILLSFSVMRFSNDFHRESELSHFVDLSKLNSDTLYIDFSNKSSNNNLPIINSTNGQHLFCVTDSMYYLNPNIKTRVIESGEEFGVEIKRMSHGSSYRSAKHNAEMINYNYTQMDSLLTLGAYCSYPIDGKFRGQHIEIIVRVPEGKSVQFVNSNPDFYDNFDSEMCKGENKSNKFIYVDSYNDRVIISKDGKKIEILEDDIDWD